MVWKNTYTVLFTICKLVAQLDSLATTSLNRFGGLFSNLVDATELLRRCAKYLARIAKLGKRRVDRGACSWLCVLLHPHEVAAAVARGGQRCDHLG